MTGAGWVTSSAVPLLYRQPSEGLPIIEHFQETGDGEIMVANGVGPMLRWDGLMSAFEPVGMDPPATALTIGGAGSGNIVGAYLAFERYRDALGNVSNLNPISAEYVATGTTGAITGATNASPISVTSAGHGLVTGAVVKIEGVGGNTSANNTWPITVVDANTFTLDDSHGTADYDGGGTWTSGVASLTYTNVPIPTEAKVVARQILRNTDGQAVTFYVDLETTDLTATTFSSTRSDSELSAQEAVPLLDSERNLFANRHDKPLTYFPFLAFHLDRMLACGSVEYTRGSIKVTNGSTTVTGVGTEWKSTMSARFLYVTGATVPYEILSIDETAQTLTLTAPYTDLSDKFAFYAIKPPPAYENLVVFTEAGLPQSWPALNGLSVQETGDRFTGIVTQGSFVYILKERHIFKLTFAIGPLTDGGIFMVASRGCVNNRCWICTDDAIFMIDELGAYRFAGRQVEPISQQIQSVFRPNSDSDLKINWKRKAFFHASLDRQQEVIRWHVCLDGNLFPHHSLCFNYRQNKWWDEPYPFAIGGSCTGEMGGLPQVYYGAAHGKILAAWQGTLDLASPDLGTVRSTVTSAGPYSLSDTQASFATTGLPNSPLAIVQGKGKGQVRKIVEASGTTLTIDTPWSILPDVTSVYQIGGVHWQYQSGWMRLAKAEENAMRTLELAYEPLDESTVADLRFAYDTVGNFAPQGVTKAFKDGGGIASIKGDVDLTIDLTTEVGLVRQVVPGHKEHHIAGRRYIQFELEGFSNEEPIRVYQWIFEGVIADSAPGP